MMEEMPEFKPSNMDKRIEREAPTKKSLHHSITDWDFQNVNWTLDAAIYHTAAPSLRGTATGAALVKNATTGALSDGRLITWARSSSATYHCLIFFRNQRADGGSDYENTYWVRIETTRIIFYKLVGGAGTELDIHAMTWRWSINTWYKFRVTWWSTAGAIYVRVERWDGDAWVTLGGDADIDFLDPDDRWKDETVNRCGFLYLTSRWFDDLEVWG